MTYKIPIDPASVKKIIPRKYCDLIDEVHSITIEAHIDLINKVMEKYEPYLTAFSKVENNKKIIKLDCNASIAKEILGLIGKDEDLLKLIHSIDHPSHQYYFEQPIQSHDFDYIPNLITCNNCKGIFLHTYLKVFANGVYGNNICPACNTFDCCELELENLQEFLSTHPEL